MRYPHQQDDSEPEEEDVDDAAPISSPSRRTENARRQSGSQRDGSPLRDITTRNSSTPLSRRAKEKRPADTLVNSIENEGQLSDHEIEIQDEDVELFMDAPMGMDDYEPNVDNEIDVVSEAHAPSVEPPMPIDDEEADETFTLQNGRSTTAANSRRKRKSDTEAAPPANKKARKDPKKGSRQPQQSNSEDAAVMPPPKTRGRPPLKKKDNNSKMSQRQEKELDEVVERVRARPNPPRSLYVLRRETPADDSVTLTRSGRMSVKPLAYWRNERCVWGGSPQSELKDGTRFPINSIKEVIRTEEYYSPAAKKGRARKKGKAKVKVEEETEEEETIIREAHVEEWEVDSGTIRGIVSEWDSDAGAPLNVEQEIDIAHSRQAIQTYVPAAKNGKETPTFKYSKLFSNDFMSVGLVDLPPGGIKKPKNAQKMQMTFYIVKGRVTASVGPVLGEMTTFSIGAGGFWQVPRGKLSLHAPRILANIFAGNQYSIENELGTEARLVFCQGCEVIPEAFLSDVEE